MFKLMFTYLATGITCSETFTSALAAVEREEELTKVTHWSGGQAYGYFYLVQL